MMRTLRTLLLVIASVCALTGCRHEDYSAYAGRYAMMSAESETAAFADFAYAALTLNADGTYSFDYKFKGTVGSMRGAFTADADAVVFSGNIEAAASYRTGYFTLTFILAEHTVTSVFALEAK